MKIHVIGRNPMGHATVARAGRSWTLTPKLVEVVDVKAGDYVKTHDRYGNPIELKDQVPCIDGDDPPPVPTDVKNGTTGRTESKLLADPDRIGKLSLKALEGDARISIKQLDSVSQDAADAAVGAARIEVARQASEIMELKAQVASLEAGTPAKVKDLQAEVESLGAELAEANDLIAEMKAAAPNVEAEAEGRVHGKMHGKGSSKGG